MDKQEIFDVLKKMLKKHSKGLYATEVIPGSKAKDKKDGYHLYGSKEVSILGRKPQKTYVAGIIMQKHFVGFYSMHVYAHPQVLKKLKSPATRKFLKGKACFNVTTLDKDILADLEFLVAEGIRDFKVNLWI